MEFQKIENLVEKYFEGQTTIAEEKKLQTYFSESDVAQHLKQYQSIFRFFEQERLIESSRKAPSKTRKQKVVWLSVAASVAVLLGVGVFLYQNENAQPNSELGSYENPEIAFRETQKALKLLSENINVGVKSVHYIHEFDNSKNKIFNK